LARSYYGPGNIGRRLHGCQVESRQIDDGKIVRRGAIAEVDTSRRRRLDPGVCDREPAWSGSMSAWLRIVRGRNSQEPRNDECK